jgi:hypothetical protein
LSLIARGEESGRKYRKLIEQLKCQKKCWRNVLRRVVAVVKSHAIPEIPVRGSQEKFGLFASQWN